MAIDILTGYVSPELATRAINAIAIERWIAARVTDKQIVSKNLALTKAPKSIELEGVGLIGVLATQRLGEKVRREFHLASGGRIKMVGTSIANRSETQRSHSRAKTNIGWNRWTFPAVWPDCYERASSKESWADKDPSPDTA